MRWVILVLAALAVGSTSALAAGDAVAGKKKAIKCSVCHGMDGIAKNPLSSNLAGQSAIYLTRAFKAYQTGERKNEQMSVIAPSVSDEDIADLAAYYSSIKIKVEVPK